MLCMQSSDFAICCWVSSVGISFHGWSVRVHLEWFLVFRGLFGFWLPCYIIMIYVCYMSFLVFLVVATEKDRVEGTQMEYWKHGWSCSKYIWQESLVKQKYLQINEHLMASQVRGFLVIMWCMSTMLLGWFFKAQIGSIFSKTEFFLWKTSFHSSTNMASSGLRKMLYFAKSNNKVYECWCVLQYFWTHW